MRRDEKYPYRQYSLPLSAKEHKIMESMYTFLESKRIPWAITEDKNFYTVWVWGEMITENDRMSGNKDKMTGELYMSGCGFEELHDNWLRDQRRAA